jgi:hypothetical protein
MRHKIKNHFDDIFTQQELFDDHLAPFRRELEEARSSSEWEQSVFYWCIQQYVPLRQFRRGEIHLAFYENFAEQPKHELDRMFSFLGRSYDDRIFDVLKRPSRLTDKWSAILTGERLVSRWDDKLSDAQRRRSLDILSLFGLDKIYSDDPMPDVANAYAMLQE